MKNFACGMKWKIFLDFIKGNPLYFNLIKVQVE